MNYRVMASYDLSKFPKDKHWMLQGRFVVKVWPTREMAESSAKGYRESTNSDLDLNSILIVEVAE